MKNFYTSKEVQQLLGCTTLRTAHNRVKAMNEELTSKGYWVERGKIPISFFYEKYPYIERK